MATSQKSGVTSAAEPQQQQTRAGPSYSRNTVRDMSEEPRGLLFSDLDSSGSGLARDLAQDLAQDRSPLKPDHCDLLLDAMDKQLGQLQVQSHKSHTRFRENGCRESVSFGWSRSVSKDTGLGSTTQTNDTPLSCQDLVQTPVDHTSESSAGFQDASEDSKQQLCKTRDRDRDTNRDRAALESRQEQVMWRLHRLLGDSCRDGDTAAQPLSNSICTEDFARRFSEEMVHDGRRAQRTSRPVPAQKGQSGASTEVSRGLWSAAQRSSELEERRGAGLKRQTDNGHIVLRAKTLTLGPQVSTSTPKTKSVAGVPVLSFDSVSVDSDLDSVCTERVRQHLHRQPGWHSFIESVRNLDELWRNHRDEDRVALEDTEPQVSCFENAEKRHKAPCPRGEANRPLVDDDDDKDLEDIGFEDSRSVPEQTAQRQRLCSLQQKCLKEEATLKLKRSELSEAERSLSKLQQRKQEAVKELEQLRAETGRLEQERKTLESVLRQNKAEKDSVSRELETLQKQKESGLHLRCSEVCREPSRALRVSEQRTDVVMVSVLERDEMERQLASAKSELFAEQRRAREKLESVQERLEEAHEELQKATDTESSLRNKCASLEDKHRQSTQRAEELESRVSDLEGVLQGCRLTVETLEKILSQKELQLLELQKLRDVVQSDRDELEERLQQLKTLHYTALREAREQAQAALETALEQQKKDLDLLHDREVQKLKEEEAKKFKQELEMEVLKKVEEERRRCEAQREEERRRWEAQREEAVCVGSRLEQQHRQREEHMNSRIQQERSKVQALHSKVTQLQRERQRAVLELERAETEADGLRRTLEERERAHSQSAAEAELRTRHWAQELQTQVGQLQVLVQMNGTKPSSGSSPTAEEALTALRSALEEVKSFTGRLHEELQSHKQSTEQLHRDKERELSVQREQLQMERDQALDSLKERLIQEHVEELSDLSVGGEGAAGGVASCLRRQLRAKDSELRQVQRSMARWKEHTAQRMAWKFEEELTAELERNILKTPQEQQKEPEVSTEEMAPEGKACPLSVGRSCPAASDTASLRLLCYLQSRVRRLRRENQSLTHSPSSTTSSTAAAALHSSGVSL